MSLRPLSSQLALLAPVRRGCSSSSFRHWRQALPDESLDVVDLQRIRRVGQAMIRLELQVGDAEVLLQHIRGLDAPLILDQRIGVAVAHEPLGVPVRVPGLLGEVLDLVAQDEVAGQAEDAGELVAGGQAREERHGAALGEAAEHDAVRGDAGADFGGQELVEHAPRSEDARFVVRVLQVVERRLQSYAKQIWWLAGGGSSPGGQIKREKAREEFL